MNGGFCLELGQKQARGREVETGEIRLDHYVGHRDGIVVADGIVDREPIEFDFRADPAHGCQRPLRVKVYRQNAVAFECEVVGQVNCGRALTAATFEVHQLPDLQLFTVPPTGQISAFGAGRLFKNLAGVSDLVCGIVPPAAAHFGGFWHRALGVQFPHELARNTQQFRGFGSGKGPKNFGAVRGESRQQMFADRRVQTC